MEVINVFFIIATCVNTNSALENSSHKWINTNFCNWYLLFNLNSRHNLFATRILNFNLYLYIK